MCNYYYMPQEARISEEPLSITPRRPHHIHTQTINCQHPSDIIRPPTRETKPLSLVQNTSLPRDHLSIFLTSYSYTKSHHLYQSYARLDKLDHTRLSPTHSNPSNLSHSLDLTPSSPLPSWPTANPRSQTLKLSTNPSSPPLSCPTSHSNERSRTPDSLPLQSTFIELKLYYYCYSRACLAIFPAYLAQFEQAKQRLNDSIYLAPHRHRRHGMSGRMAAKDRCSDDLFRCVSLRLG